MKKNYVIGICSVGTNYHKKTKNLIKQIKDVIDVKILVLTDDPDQFQDFPDVIVVYYTLRSVSYTLPVFSFHAKRLIFEEGFKHSNTVLMLDADHCIREGLAQRLLEFNSEPLLFGAYPQIIWKYPLDCSMEHFLDGLTPRVPYGKEFNRYCIQKEYKLENSFLIQESFLIIKESPEKISKFLEVWKVLQEFCENKDIERNQHTLGYGEGYSIGVSLNTAGIAIIEGNAEFNLLTEAFKHFAWEV